MLSLLALRFAVPCCAVPYCLTHSIVCTHEPAVDMRVHAGKEERGRERDRERREEEGGRDWTYILTYIHACIHAYMHAHV